MACLDDGQVLLLLEGRLSDGERSEVETHLDGCDMCRHVVGAAARSTANAGHGELRGGVLGRGVSIGRYLVLSLLGEGGMGRVYAAYDPELDRRVALKLLRAPGGGGGARGRLVREARALGRLSHPNVVQVHDVGEHDGDVFIAMELVEGQSLGAWCEGSPRPGWQEVLAAYLDAARGLAAAHEKGIVHRDVKPSNILRGKDGRVRVVDFGLAAGRATGVHEAERVDLLAMDTPEGRRLAETIPAASDSDVDRGDPLTATGALLGTPLYMAPEQFERSGVGPASDQHNLCTALHEALYGVLPFPVAPGPGQLIRLVARKNEGPPAAPPPGSPVPASVFRALARGLAARPEERFASMTALVEALREEPPRPRTTRRVLAALGAAAAIVAGVAAFRSGAFQDPCAHTERQLAGAWDDDVRGRVHAALAGTGRSYAVDTAQRVTALLDRYGASWATMRAEVCQASRRGTQRRELTASRDECLDRRLGQLQALTGLYAEKADVTVLDKAVQAAAGLRPVASCADTEALTARVRPPEDPVLRARVTELQPRVDRLEALYQAGKYKEGLALGEPLTAEAGEMPYAPLRAQLQCWMGSLREGAGDYEGAKQLLRDAAVSAAQGGDDIVEATAWTRLTSVVGERQQRKEEAAILRAIAPIVVHTRDERTLAAWLNAEGLVLFRAGENAEARARYERALAILDKAGIEDAIVASICNNLGNALSGLDEAAPARAMYERAVALRERVLGPDHPDNASPLNNLGTMLEAHGEYAAARPLLERAVAIWETALGPDHVMVGSGLFNLGTVGFDVGEYREAAGYFARALAIFQKALAPDHPSATAALLGLGRARTRLGELDAALPLLERGLSLSDKGPGPHPEAAMPLLFLAELYLARRQPEQAVPLLERAVVLGEDDYPEIPLTLAEALGQVGKDRPRARALAEKAGDAYARLGHRPGQDRAARFLADHPR